MLQLVQLPLLLLVFDIDQIKNYEQARVIDALMGAVKILRTTSSQTLDAEASGFVLHLRNGEIDPDQREKLTHLVDRCAKKLRERIV